MLTVGPGQQFGTIADAVAASSSGDTIDVQAGTYTNDFVYIGYSLTLQAVGGEVKMVATVEPYDGKAIITEGVPGANVAINGFDISGAAVGDDNGAAVRYEGGNLSLSNDYFHNNQEGLLGAADPNGSITVDNSEFAFNGDGSGFTHGIYAGHIAGLTITNSYFHDTAEGHEIKSRANNTTVTDSRVFDNQSTASYSIDLPNGGNATISNDVIEQGPNSDNPFIIAYGEEGQSNPGTAVSISGNTIVNDQHNGNDAVVLNRTGTAPSFTNNQVWGLSPSQLVSGGGHLADSGTIFLASRPSLDTSSLSFITGGGSSSPPPSGGSGGSGGGNPTTPATVTVGSGADTLDLKVNEDAWNGDAQFTVAVDGQQIGGTLTALASHAAGVAQDFLVDGNFGPGQHTATVTFLNDAYGGSPATDRNLYITGATYNGGAASGSLALYSGGSQSLVVGSNPGGSNPGGSDPATVTVGSGADTLDLKVNEDAWNGDAQFTVAVDGQQIGGTLAALASHAAGAAQDLLIMGNFGPGQHTATVTFLNDAYGGSPATDRNLYVTGASYDGQPVSGSSLNLFWTGSGSFAF